MTDNQVSEPRKDTAANIKLTSKQGKAALRELLAPVQLALRVGRVMAVISAILRVFPFVALVGIGNELLTSLGNGAPKCHHILGTGVNRNILWRSIRLFCGLAGYPYCR